MRRMPGRTVFCVASAVAMTAVAHAQGRPQLVVQRAEADLAAETLVIEGQNLLSLRPGQGLPRAEGQLPAGLDEDVVGLAGGLEPLQVPADLVDEPFDVEHALAERGIKGVENVLRDGDLRGNGPRSEGRSRIVRRLPLQLAPANANDLANGWVQVTRWSSTKRQALL